MVREPHLNENSKRERELFATEAGAGSENHRPQAVLALATEAWDCGAGSENRRPKVVLALATEAGAGSENRTRN